MKWIILNKGKRRLLNLSQKVAKDPTVIKEVIENVVKEGSKSYPSKSHEARTVSQVKYINL